MEKTIRGKNMKCQICKKEVKPTTEYVGDWSINAAIVSGDFIELKGHKVCCESVNDLVVIPNRMKLLSVEVKQ